MHTCCKNVTLRRAYLLLQEFRYAFGLCAFGAINPIELLPKVVKKQYPEEWLKSLSNFSAGALVCCKEYSFSSYLVRKLKYCSNALIATTISPFKDHAEGPNRKKRKSRDDDTWDTPPDKEVIDKDSVWASSDSPKKDENSVSFLITNKFFSLISIQLNYCS